MSLAGVHRPKASHKLDLNREQTGCRQATKINEKENYDLRQCFQRWLCPWEGKGSRPPASMAPHLLQRGHCSVLLYFFLLFLIPKVSVSNVCNLRCYIIILNSERDHKYAQKHWKSCVCFLRELPLETLKAMIENLCQLK